MGDSGGSQSVGRSRSHLCWVFDDHADFRAAAVEYLADGLARGLRVRYIAAGDEESLRAELAPLERFEEARRPGVVEVLPVSVWGADRPRVRATFAPAGKEARDLQVVGAGMARWAAAAATSWIAGSRPAISSNWRLTAWANCGIL